MPRIHISMRSGKSEAYRQAIFDSLYQALLDALNVPEDDQFMTITEHDAANFRRGDAFAVTRSDDLVYIQITVLNTRTVEQKKALFQRIAELLSESPGIRPEDVFVNLYDTPKENWSLGLGLTQFISDDASPHSTLQTKAEGCPITSGTTRQKRSPRGLDSYKKPAK